MVQSLNDCCRDTIRHYREWDRLMQAILDSPTELAAPGLRLGLLNLLLDWNDAHPAFATAASAIVAEERVRELAQENQPCSRQ